MNTFVDKLQDSVVSTFRGWKPFELIWLTVAVATIITLTLIWQDTLLGGISSVAGVLCVVLAAKGKIATFYVGVIQAATYAYISYGYGLYGEAMLNGLFYLPIQFVGLYLWTRHRKERTQAIAGEDVFAKRLTKKQWLIFTPLVLAAVVGYALILQAIGAQQVRLDSAAVVLSIAAQFLMLFRYAEQWILWIVVNLLSITLWVVTLVSSGGNDWALVAMWSAFLLNSVYGYLNWRRLSKPALTEAGDDTQASAVVEVAAPSKIDG